MMTYMQERFKLDTGYSDHTSGNSISIAAVVKGAKVVEKHFTLSKAMYGSDAQFASEPHEFKQLVDSIRDVDIALASTISKQDVTSELNSMKITFEKSIVSKRALKTGDTIKVDDLAFKKPGSGIPAKEYKNLLGKVVVRNIKPNTRIEYSDYE